ncbi:MAG TPA: hypothetical protein DCZ94_08855 [Lentisphaeria bacterium]|nr:hypothetical protein [Lentisphaeria bacterium]
MMIKILATVLISSSFVLVSYSETAPAKENPQSGAKAVDAPSATPPFMGKPPEIAEAKVLKAFSAEIDGARFRAYLVNWKNAEIIVTDPYGITDRKEGDVIKFMVQKMDFPDRGSTVRFVIVNMSAIRKPDAKLAPSGKAPEVGK